MSQFSPSDVALEGFRLTRERPLPVLIWAVLRLAYGLGTLFLLFGGAAGPAFTKMLDLSKAQPQPDPAVMLPLMAQIAPMLALMVVVSLLFYAVIYTAVLRAILRPTDRAFFYLRLSIDEVRQFGLAVIIFAVFLVYVFVLEIISAVLIAASKSLGQASLLAQILVILALIVAFVYPAVRLSLAPAMTFAEGRITLFRSLPVTKQQFWPMMGTYVLAMILTLVVSLLAAVMFVFVVGAIGAAQGGLSNVPALFGVMQPDDMSLKAFLTPMGIAKLVFNALLSTLVYVILFAPAGAIFRELTSRAGGPSAAPVVGLRHGRE
jgi:hypothetical protein